MKVVILIFISIFSCSTDLGMNNRHWGVVRGKDTLFIEQMDSKSKKKVELNWCELNMNRMDWTGFDKVRIALKICSSKWLESVSISFFENLMIFQRLDEALENSRFLESSMFFFRRPDDSSKNRRSFESSMFLRRSDRESFDF